MNIHWDDASIPCRDIDFTTNDVFVLSQYNAPLKSETRKSKCILNAKYYEADNKTIAKRSTHIDHRERNEPCTILKMSESLFDGNLGKWHGKPYDIKLEPDS